MLEWAFLFPYFLNALRALVPLGLAAIPRNHPARDILAANLIFIGIASDLVDGGIARALEMTGSQLLFWTDHGADLIFVLGACAVLGTGASLARDLERPAFRDKAMLRRETRVLVGWIGLTVLLAGVAVVLMFARMFHKF